MRQFLTAAFVLLSFSAIAGERIVDINVYQNLYELDGKSRNFTVWNFDIRNVDKKIKLIEPDYCGYEEISCTQKIVLEKEKVLQITVQYEDETGFSDESPYEYVEVNLPLTSISEEDLETMKLNGGNWDLLGRKSKARMRIAKKNFDIKVVDRKKTVQVIDYYNSTLCDMDDSHWCREDIRYVSKVITVKDFSIAKK